MEYILQPQRTRNLITPPFTSEAYLQVSKSGTCTYDKSKRGSGGVGKLPIFERHHDVYLILKFYVNTA